MENEKILDNVIGNLREIDTLTNKTEKLVGEYINKKFPKGIAVFNDETGYPTFFDDNEGERPVVAIKTDNNGFLLFNVDVDENDELMEKCWFEPRTFGTFDLNNVVNYLCEL